MKILMSVNSVILFLTLGQPDQPNRQTGYTAIETYDESTTGM